MSDAPDTGLDTGLDTATVNATLNSPQHRAGLNDLTLTVTAVTRRYPWLARVTGTVEGMAATDPETWRHPNLAVRLAIPDPEDALGPMIGQPGVCRRVYTLAAVDYATSTVDIDIVIHGDTSPMMRWVAGLTPGDRVDFAGPRPHAAPVDTAVDTASRIHLLADGSAYPAASAIARSIPGVASVILAVPEENPQVGTYAADFPGAQLQFVTASATPLADALPDLPVAPGDTVWAAGEREDIRAVRTFCLKDLGLPKSHLQVFGYWRTGKTGTDADVARLGAIARLQAEGRQLTAEDDFDVDI
ncbi:siderophore-interacting protein [Corynebacterium terpenotabidum]|uniref:Iron-siderophore binding protein n=1 Tax=Corynebacterium terpenotabidum Y-11 TaxID=1200352 RepID=S4XDN8_9CORY|nr:siderophore-interacting protein [Corynebacterium terpenotabidum]AGP29705.1 iron-siderophore binding protein [Corynebacterium terpenotabidum Y-11]